MTGQDEQKRGDTAIGGSTGRRLVLTDDQHQQSLYRLAAVDQYLYDCFGNDENRGKLPLLALEQVRAAQEAISEAIKQGQRTRRRCLGGELTLNEERGPQAP